MNKNQVSIIMKEKLNTAINEVCQNPWLFAINPGADFTRTRKMPIRELLRAIFGMRGNSLNKELYDYFKDRDEHITASAFVQQRAKLLQVQIARPNGQFCGAKRTRSGASGHSKLMI